jgi:hypothetical protein
VKAYIQKNRVLLSYIREISTEKRRAATVEEERNTYREAKSRYCRREGNIYRRAESRHYRRATYKGTESCYCTWIRGYTYREVEMAATIRETMYKGTGSCYRT